MGARATRSSSSSLKYGGPKGTSLFFYNSLYFPCVLQLLGHRTQALDDLKTDRPIIAQILPKLNSLIASGFDIRLLIIECADFKDVWQRFYCVPTLQDLFKTVKPEVILDFSKAAALYEELTVA